MAALLTPSLPARQAEERRKRIREVLLEPFYQVNSVGADIRIHAPSIARAQTGFTFYAHKDRLSRASTVFRDLFEVCGREAHASAPSEDALPKIDVDEPIITFAFIIGILYENAGVQYSLLQTDFEQQSLIWHGGIKYDSAVVTALAEQAMQ